MEFIRGAVRHHEQGYEAKERITLDSNISKWSRYSFRAGAAVVAGLSGNPAAAVAIGAGAFGAGHAGKALCDSDRGKAF